VHGKVADISHTGEAVFKGLPSPYKATRYHSLSCVVSSLPTELAVTAETEDGLIMGLSHITIPCMACQFHPESIASEQVTRF